MDSGIQISDILIVTAIMFFIGVYGFVTRKNLIAVMMALELIINAAAINFIMINKLVFKTNLHGVFFGLFIIAVAAVEVAIGLVIILNLYRLRDSIDPEEITTLKH